MGGKPPGASNNGSCNLVTEVLIAAGAAGAGLAGAGKPSHPHKLTGLEMMDRRAQGGDFAHNFVTWDERVLRHAPVAIDHFEVGMADSAGEDFQENFVGAEIPKGELVGGEGTSGREGSHGLYSLRERGQTRVLREKCESNKDGSRQ
jgi:hypothetical protein